ncbi:hypothetical protein TNCV_3957291 [Trichonephila clavipes]|nr:hypothetical protein TNCV_3957291 [Trichonephila clavipes]
MTCVRRYLNEYLPQRWIGRTDDKALLKWTSRSSNMTLCDYFLWGFIKDKAFVPLYLEIWWSSESGSEMNLQEMRWCEYGQKWSIA